MISSNCGILSETVPLPRISPLIKDPSRPALGIRMTSPPCEGLQLPVTRQGSLMHQARSPLPGSVLSCLLFCLLQAYTSASATTSLCTECIYFADPHTSLQLESTEFLTLFGNYGNPNHKTVFSTFPHIVAGWTSRKMGQIFSLLLH